MSSAVSTPTTATKEGEQDKQEEDQSVEESSEGGEEEKEELPVKQTPGKSIYKKKYQHQQSFDRY